MKTNISPKQTFLWSTHFSRFGYLGWIRSNLTLTIAIFRFGLFFDFLWISWNCVLNICIRRHEWGVRRHMGVYGCVTDAYESIRMHTDAYRCMWMHAAHLIPWPNLILWPHLFLGPALFLGSAGPRVGLEGIRTLTEASSPYVVVPAGAGPFVRSAYLGNCE